MGGRESAANWKLRMMMYYDKPCTRYPAFGGLEQLSEPLSPEEGNHVNCSTTKFISI